MTRAISGLLIVFTGYFVPAAEAALTCQQVVAVAQTTLTLRDQGLSLSAVLADVERSDIREALNAQEINLLRQIVRVSFTSEYSPREIMDACNAGNLGLSRSISS